MSNVIITIREGDGDNLDVKCEFEPVIPAHAEFDDLPFTHKLAIAMMEVPTSMGAEPS